MDHERHDDDATQNDDWMDEIVIDDRFTASGPDDETAFTPSSTSSPSMENTVATPQNLMPDSFQVGAEDASDEAQKETDSLVGQSIDNYEVVSALGEGGFGIVYKAKDTKLQRFAALKFLRFPLDAELRKNFAHEAQVIANLSKHPSIVQIYSWGEYQGSQYFALEFLDASVDSMIKGRGEPLSVKQSLEIVADCAGALHYAHEQGILHRDIKPANILLDRKTGRAKVCDFGLARFNALAMGTATTTIAGSPSYMAPEQIVGEAMDGRTDVYALGVTLYEMLSKELPCKGKNHYETLDNIRSHKSTPLRKYRPDLSSAVLEIVKRATTFRPEERFQTAEEMEQACRDILRSLETTGSTDNVSVKSSRRVPALSGSRFRASSWMAAAAAFLILVGGTLFGPQFLGSGDGSGDLWPQAVASAREQIDSGQYDEAKAWLESYVQENESDDFAHYALGYAHLLSDEVEEAETSFTKVADAGLREEGLAAVQHAMKGEAARGSIQTASASIPSAYPAVLLASLDVLNDKYNDAIDRLESVDKSDFNFDWQRRRYDELMARAYYNTQQFAKAEAILGGNAAASTEMAESVNELYTMMAKRQLNEDRRGAVQAQIDQVKALAEQIKSGGAGSQNDADHWTSRPIRVRISPASSSNSRIAEESGLVGVFPDLMANALVSNDEMPIELVDREYIGDVLYEQQLAELSQEVDSIRLQQLLGARVMIESEFKGLMGENWVNVRIIDTETSGYTSVESESFDQRTDARAWARELGAKTVQAIREEYPIRGILTSGSNGAQLNVGKDVGVEEGMKFAVHSAPGAEHELENVSATVSSVGQSTATVTLQPSGVAIPRDGWYLEQIVE